MLEEFRNDGGMAIITEQRRVYSLVKARLGKHILGTAQDIFKPFPIKLNKGGSSSNRQIRYGYDRQEDQTQLEGCRKHGAKSLK